MRKTICHSRRHKSIFVERETLADTCALRRCISKSNDAHKSRRSTAAADDVCGSPTPRWQRQWHVHSPSIVSAPQQCILLASTAPERESRAADDPPVVSSRGGRGRSYRVFSHESRRRTFAVWQALRTNLAANLAYIVVRDLLASFLCVFVLVDAPAACQKAPQSRPL